MDKQSGESKEEAVFDASVQVKWLGESEIHGLVGLSRKSASLRWAAVFSFDWEPAERKFPVS